MESSSPTPPPPEKDHVNLRMIYLVTGNPRPPHSLGNVHVNTTIADLKTKIQSELPEHPSPPEQRLIYQGRPLLQNNATLRDVLRIEPGQDSGPLPHTIHIVIQPLPNTTHPQPPPNPVLNPPPPAPLPATQHQHHHAHADPNSPFRAAETSANRLQESLVRIQQQIEANRADLRSVQQRIALQHTNLGGPPGPGHGHTNGLNANGQPMTNLAPPGFVMNFQPPTRAPSHPHQHPNATPAPPAQGPSSTGAAWQNIPQHGFPPQRMTMMTETMNFRIPMQRPSSAPGQRSLSPSLQQSNIPVHTSQNSNPTAAPMLQPPALMMPTMTMPPMPLPASFLQPRLNSAQPANTTAWLLSSPAGPQALLFAPGHGYFSSFSPLVAQHAGSATDPQPQANTVTGAAVPQPEQGVQQGQPNADLAVVRPDQPQPAPALAQAQQNGQDNDVFAFLINRGWLFLRLYIFMFVFSEPGTWKRWLMIIAAAIVCLQPRDGPFTRLMTAARRHFDNLVGPPAQQPRPEGGAQAQANPQGQPRPDGPQHEGGVQRPANVRGAVQMTPEEAAARIVADRRGEQEPQPRFWRNAFYRTEQSIALFLASLIPGVGERHVRAREDARREEQRREEERRRAEEEAAAVNDNHNVAQEDAQVGEGDDQPTSVKPEVGLGGRGEQSASSSVQVASDEPGGELRNRA
ncbi:hypothetical protein H2200_000612 [Cladophialophora chaetospira]|uniref:Ubiquitin-like domain-containing protein n=1 Tax=Cladophialophora chaetospira TaxID=386627 RepID=A0AA38XNW3_9EURO|nr:hypothetical protein H2200_000612 [Cladophialophora chaetospira]